MNNRNREKLNKYIGIVNNKLEELLDRSCCVNMQGNVMDAMRYSAEAGGKRIRPALVLEFAEVCGGDIKSALSCACAIEMVHTFSLIHDDLPGMDNDDFRRGKPSCHVQFGEAMAILAGDALSAMAFGIIAKDRSIDDKQKVMMIKELADAIGADGMIGGQVIDIENESRAGDIDEENLINMCRLKTGALLKASCRLGCISADADGDIIEKAGLFGEKLGLAFQIVDDILDVTGDEKTLGKPIGSDEQQNKTTFVSLYGIEGSKRKAEELTYEAMGILDEFKGNDFLKELTELLLVREK